jgi:hypothetical protein
MRRGLLALVLALSAGFASAARGGSAASGPFLVRTDEIISCVLSNLGTKPGRDAVVELVRFGTVEDGEIVGTSTGEVAPLTQKLVGLVNQDPPAFYGCRFSWRGGGKGLRGSALLGDAGGHLDALPAQ